MLWRLPLLPLMLVGLAGCAGDGTLRSSVPGPGYSYAPVEQLPHPGIAEGRPVIEVDGATFYACPPVAAGGATPMIEDPCLTPSDAGYTKYGAYWLMEPSVDCPDGRRATDAGALGWGFVGQPLIGQRQTAPERAAVLDCLRAAGR